MSKQEIKEIIENALLIGKFEGYETYHENGYDQIRYSEDNERTAQDTAYHLRWDWLMPVIKRIEELEIKVHFKTVFCDFNIMTNAVIVIKQNENKPMILIDKLGGIGSIQKKSYHFETKIGAVYNAVVEFIRWYNENEKWVNECEEKWVCTDPSTNQYRKQLTENSFEFKEDRILDPETKEIYVYTSIIDLSDYEYNELFENVEAFGYSYNEMCSWLESGENLDLIAECIFEMEY